MSIKYKMTESLIIETITALEIEDSKRDTIFQKKLYTKFRGNYIIGTGHRIELSRLFISLYFFYQFPIMAKSISAPKPVS